jgi:2-keto-4-pentenoate hydratase/2-oxohepta-3-ene-1,7-dioic acid hydratase in catechol pathway
MDEENYNLTEALNIYQTAKGANKKLSIAFLQMFIEMGYCSGAIINNVFNEPWVKSKIKDLIITSDFIYGIPVPRPSKIICLGRNYKAHARELKHTLPKEPLIFSKAPSSLIAHNEKIIIPSWLEGRVDHEAELALVIGKTGKDIPEEDAFNYLAGYTIINDVTARDMQKKDLQNSNPWFRSKSLDTFSPLGPFIIPADEMKNPHNLKIKLKINHKIKQNASTADMLFKIPEIISYISKYMTLQSGDIIATGTPEGVSEIKDGDTIEITISSMGTLQNTVVKE